MKKKHTKRLVLKLAVEILEVKPNKMFTPWQHATTRFLRFSKPVACAVCGKKKRIHMTLLVSFQAADLQQQFGLKFPPKEYPPLTPTCDHILRPLFEGDK